MVENRRQTANITVKVNCKLESPTEVTSSWSRNQAFRMAAPLTVLAFFLLGCI